MASPKLRGNDLRKLGYPERRASNRALNILQDRQLSKLDKGSALALLQKIKADPHAYLRDSLWRELTQKFVPDPSRSVGLNPQVKNCRRYGEAFIEDGARRQMDTATQLPVTLDGALMPDAHQGYAPQVPPSRHASACL